MNGAWHRRHPMPKSPTLDRRLQWHVEHAKFCGCRAMPASIAKEMKRRETDARDVPAHLRALPAAAKRRMRNLRSTLLSVVPGGVDGFSYRMPCVRLNGNVVVWYGAFTSHTSLFPMTERIRKAHAKALAGLETAKGTVRFPLERPLPVSLVRRLVRARLAEMT